MRDRELRVGDKAALLVVDLRERERVGVVGGLVRTECTLALALLRRAQRAANNARALRRRAAAKKSAPPRAAIANNSRLMSCTVLLVSSRKLPTARRNCWSGRTCVVACVLPS